MCCGVIFGSELVLNALTMYERLAAAIEVSVVCSVRWP